jgi:cytochrome c oxidase cbb3-type subunit III
MADHDSPPVDRVTGTATTGHEWDGIRELNTPLPRWWLWIFYATIVWSIGYWVVYPSWPLISSYTAGSFGWSSRDDVGAELEALRLKRSAMMAKMSSASLQEIYDTPELLSFSRAIGRFAFGDNCAPCHGSGGAGAKGYANLLDDEWLWGGKLKDIEATIRHGVRSTDSSGRQGSMPAFGRDGILPQADIEAAADHVLRLANLPVAQNVNRERGAKVFAESCAACHGDDGKGKREVGAPNLTDQVWLYGNSRAVIIEGLVNGRGGVMPPWLGRLDEPTIKALAVYVYALGGGEK